MNKILKYHFEGVDKNRRYTKKGWCPGPDLNRHAVTSEGF